MTQAASLDELEASLHDAMHTWIDVQLERGQPIPLPRSDDEPSHSGKFLVRLPKTLHAAVAAEAESEGVSLNAFVVAALSGAVGWRSTPTSLATQPAERADLADRLRTHVTPDELARECDMKRETLIRFVHEHSIPIWHGRIDRSLFLAVFEDVMASSDQPPSH